MKIKGLTGCYTVGIVLTVTGEELRQFRQRLGLTQAQFAQRVGVASNSVARWERDERAISEPVARLIRLLAKTEPKRRKRRGGR